MKQSSQTVNKDINKDRVSAPGLNPGGDLMVECAYNIPSTMKVGKSIYYSKAAEPCVKDGGVTKNLNPEREGKEGGDDRVRR